MRRNQDIPAARLTLIELIDQVMDFYAGLGRGWSVFWMKPERHLNVIVKFFTDGEIMGAEINQAGAHFKPDTRILAEEIPALTGTGSYYPPGGSFFEAQ